MKQKGASLFLFKEEDDENVMSILSKYKFEEYILPRLKKNTGISWIKKRWIRHFQILIYQKTPQII